MDPYAHAVAAAERLVKERSITALPVSPFSIAMSDGIKVVAKPVDGDGVSGMLISANGGFAIVYATHITSEGFQKFCVAHELGHYHLPGHPEAILGPEGIHRSRAGFASGDKYEREADHFAAGLLMPRHLFVPAMRTAGEGFSAIEQLAQTCETSLTSTAIRYATCADEPVAVVVSQGRYIEYCFMSPSLRDIPDIDWIRKNEPLPTDSATYAFNQDPARVSSAERADGSGDLRDWFGGTRGIELSEDVVGLGAYGKTLTVLFGIEEPDEEEEEDEDALVESWTPRFRR